MKLKLLLLGLTILTFTGCGIYQSSFDCKPGKGVGCVSAWHVDDMILENEGEEAFDKTEHLFDPQRSDTCQK